MSKELTKGEVGRLRMLQQRATQGTWKLEKDGSDYARALSTVENPRDSLLGLDKDGMAVVWSPHDAALIVEVVNSLSKLLDAAERSVR